MWALAGLGSCPCPCLLCLLCLRSTPCAPCMHACVLRRSLPPPAQAADASRGGCDAALPRATSALHLDAAAAAIGRFEAEAAPRIPVDTLSEASLEDLRLQAPALCPMGCWCTGCAPLPPQAPAQGRPPVLADAGRAPAVAEALACRARAGAATCPARRRRACGCSCAPAAAPRATARQHARRQPGARATRARASACRRAPGRTRRRSRACRRNHRVVEGFAGEDSGLLWVGVGYRATGGQWHCPGPWHAGSRTAQGRWSPVLTPIGGMQCVPVIRSAAARVGGAVGRAWCMLCQFWASSKC